jgi:hypothetical protein
MISTVHLKSDGPELLQYPAVIAENPNPWLCCSKSTTYSKGRKETLKNRTLVVMTMSMLLYADLIVIQLMFDSSTFMSFSQQCCTRNNVWRMTQSCSYIIFPNVIDHPIYNFELYTTGWCNQKIELEIEQLCCISMTI